MSNTRSILIVVPSVTDIADGLMARPTWFPRATEESRREEAVLAARAIRVNKLVVERLRRRLEKRARQGSANPLIATLVSTH